jgi:hypothetical protein
MTRTDEVSGQPDFGPITMRLRAKSPEFSVVFTLVSVSVLLGTTALLRLPHSKVVLALFAVTVLANAGLVRWCLRSNGSIEITNDELVVSLRTGRTIRRNLREIQSVEWNRVQRRLNKGEFGTESYVRIFTTGDVPLQFLWDEYRRKRRESSAVDLIGELQRRLPDVVAVESSAKPERLKVLRARRNSRTSHVLFLAVVVWMSTMAGLLTHLIIPKSSGSASSVLRQVERSLLVGATSLESLESPESLQSVDSSASANSEPCFGSRSRPSYWLEKLSAMEIRRVNDVMVVTIDPLIAAENARKLLPNDWSVSGFDGLPEIMGRRRLYVQTPCLSGRRGEFSSSLEMKFAGIMKKLRVQVDRQP